MNTMAEKKMGLQQQNDQVLHAWNDRSMSAADRAQMIVFYINEHGQDYLPAVTQLIQESDENSQSMDLIKSMGQEPLVTERYLGPANVKGVGRLACAITGTKYAMTTSKDSVQCLPCDIKEELGVGDLVMIHPKAQRIVGKDGDLVNVGYVATVESIPEGTTGQVIVKSASDTKSVAWLHHSLIENPPKPGEQVIYDERHRFVLSKINTETKGEELLADNLPIVRREQVGSPHPIAEQIVSHFRDSIEHPEWLKALGSRDRKSYLFIGQTGGGKSYHIKLIATEISDLIEEHTGHRHSRVVLCDASQFWSPYFGETEQRINTWSKKVSKLGLQTLKDKEGNELKVPILMVIEECEALFRTRGGDQGGSGHLFDRVLALLLQKLESVENAIGVPVVWVCSTNKPDLIDAAAMRRIGMRKAIFGNLKAAAAKLVMLAKTQELKVDQEQLANQVVDYLFHTEEGQQMANVTFQNNKERVLHRKDLVTPAILEEATSFAVDQCLERSRSAGRLQQIKADDVVEFLHKHFNSLAGMLTPNSLPEYCPEWFAQDAVPVRHVKVIR